MFVIMDIHLAVVVLVITGIPFRVLIDRLPKRKESLNTTKYT